MGLRSDGVQNWVQVAGGAKEVVKGIREGVQLEHAFESIFTELLVKLGIAGTIAADTNILIVQAVVSEEHILCVLLSLDMSRSQCDAKNVEDKTHGLEDTVLLPGLHSHSQG